MNTVVADSITRLANAVGERLAAGEDLERAVREVVAETYREHGRIVFGGDGYSAEWEAEAAERGLLNLRTTPDALPYLVDEATVRVFAEQSVLSARELQARYDVLVEQYSTKLNIEAHTAAQIARTMLLPAALRHRELIKTAGGPLAGQLLYELDGPLREFHTALGALEEVNEGGADGAQAHAEYMRDRTIPAMNRVRAVADRLERLVADDLWPLPRYAEMLFIR
jgi:glutamine synthetase